MKVLSWKNEEVWKEKSWEDIPEDKVMEYVKNSGYDHFLLFKEGENDTLKVLHINRNFSISDFNEFLTKDIKNRYYKPNKIDTNFAFVIELEKANRLIDNWVQNCEFEGKIEDAVNWLVYDCKIAKDAREWVYVNKYKKDYVLIGREILVIGFVDNDGIKFYVVDEEKGFEYQKIYEENKYKEFKTDWEKRVAGLAIDQLKKQGRM